MAHQQKHLFLFIFFGLFSFIFALQKDTFDEELLLKPLPNGHVYAYFQFTTRWEATNNANNCK